MARTLRLPVAGTKPHYPNNLHAIFTFPNSSNTSIFIHPNKSSTFYGLLNLTRLITICNTQSHHIIRKTSTSFCVPLFSVFPFYRSSSSSSFFSSVMSQNNDHALTSPQDSIKTVKCAIKGRVQGVFYRNWTIENATQLGLKGWVRNRRDGSVEALFSGNTEAVDEMMQRCRRGPPNAMVTAFQAYPCNEDAGTSFERRPTV